MTVIPSTILAAILILSRKILATLERKPDSAREICRVLGTSESQAYEMLGRLEECLPGLKNSPGRPLKPAADPADLLAVTAATRDFLMDHPGAVEGAGCRRRYHQSFRLFVLSLLSEDETSPAVRLGDEEFAHALGIPLGTLKGWLTSPSETDDSGAEGNEIAGSSSTGTEAPTLESSNPIILLILREYARWNGSFGKFYRHLQEHHRIAASMSFVGKVLQLGGLRRGKKRKKPVTPWSRGTFQALFPGAQWLGDGKAVVFHWCGQSFAFLLEAILDTASGGLLGFRVRDAEDEAAVLAAYTEAKETAGSPPLGFTLDNRPSNHTEGIQQAVTGRDDARLLRSTPGRGQSKAPMEGAFGLFEQQMPDLVLTGETERERARDALQLAITAWARGRNGRPRKKFGGKTPAEIYQEAAPTPEEIQAAKKHLADLARIQELSRRTEEAKSDPIRRQLLVEGLTTLAIPDPEGQLATALARYSLEAIQRGLARFRAKDDRNTLPPGVDRGRYLGGIIRNIDAELEDELFAEHLLELRRRAGEISLAHLERQAQEIARESPVERPAQLLGKALEAKALLDFRFWSWELRESLGELGSRRLRRASYNWLLKTVRKSHETPRNRRSTLIAYLSEALVATEAKVD